MCVVLKGEYFDDVMLLYQLQILIGFGSAQRIYSSSKELCWVCSCWNLFCRYFEKQLELSGETKLPLFLHCRNSFPEFMSKKQLCFETIMTVIYSCRNFGKQ